MGTIGVLCARIRVEEKQIAAALAEAGASLQPIQPAALPMPPAAPAPLPPAPALAGGLAGQIVLDRLQTRAVASALTRSLRLRGAVVLGAGIAATGDRLAVAAALAGAGLPRPACWLAPDDDTALAAVEAAGYPATLLPLAYDSEPIALPDRDTAEAVTEHRMVLGAGIERLSLVQAGVGLAAARVIVVDGLAVAAQTPDGAAPAAAAARLAEAAAAAVDADICGVQIVDVGGVLLVWDIDPAPDFRHAAPLGDQTAAGAVAALAIGRLGGAASADRAGALLSAFSLDREEIRGAVILTA